MLAGQIVRLSGRMEVAGRQVCLLELGACDRRLGCRGDFESWYAGE